ncbi:GTPase Era [Helicobacter cetorum]|uniref:GTPase Era n=1 Tax=Helicobacter cetorum (strain ATCC BAA-429 / MIT 00-7128) TaxID=182217 RepID=I0EMY8_HELC0|nr:GTPase Era [Helicobacter cetorum]AFI04307.1 GTPase Era [Helicobacter cetorum MIT 00-7128]
MKTKAGFVALVGKPNAGKSTLLNTLLNLNLALVSHKANATRKLMKCIVPYEDKEGYQSQIIFLDTPGLHHQEKLLNQYMLSEALKAMSDCELCVFLASVHDDLKGYEEFLKLCQKPHIVALSKIDMATEKQVLEKLQAYQTYASQFLALVPLSAKKSRNLDVLLECISTHLEPSPWLYEKDLMSDEKMRDLYKEAIRESLFKFLSDEIPYESDVIIDKFIEEEHIDKVYAYIIVEKESQKKIVIGKNGINIKRIGTQSRLKMQELGDKKVFLDLQVVVQKAWSKEEKSLQKLGYANTHKKQ